MRLWVQHRGRRNGKKEEEGRREGNGEKGERGKGQPVGSSGFISDANFSQECVKKVCRSSRVNAVFSKKQERESSSSRSTRMDSSPGPRAAGIRSWFLATL